MAQANKIINLTSGHRKASGLSDSISEKNTELQKKAAEAYLERHEDLRDIPPHILRKAWFNMSHLMLPKGAKVANMGCVRGDLTYAMAKLYPDLHFTGVDSNKKAITAARRRYKLPNLSFQVGNLAKGEGFEPESLDAIINAFVLHDVYSRGRYNERCINQALENQFNLLKPDGLMFIRDYALQMPGEYIYMELPDSPSSGDSIAEMSEADLLVWYSHKARPLEGEGCQGFFLEELPPRFPQTRLFRLTYKWAYEFVIRKDDRENFEDNLYKEHTYFTERDFRKNLRSMGARALYTSPFWDESYISANFEGRFRLLDKDGNLLGPPPTSFIVVAQKTGADNSLLLRERRPSQKESSRLRIVTMRNEQTGKLTDIVTRDAAITNLLPYRTDHEGRLFVFLHESLPRGLVNAVPRNGGDIDGKRWSGHMIEALSVSSDIIDTVESGGYAETVKFTRDYLGLLPADNKTLEKGMTTYPAPEFIDEVVQTRYLEVRESDGPRTPKAVMEDLTGFTTQGRLREIDAQHVLNAIAVGYIPNARLETQLVSLYEKLGIKPEVWKNCPLVLQETPPEQRFDARNFAELKAHPDSRYREIRGTAGELRKIQSLFVDEGWVEGAATGIASKDIDFVISEEETLNKAVIIPLTKAAGEVMIGFETEHLPVPQRHEGNGLTLKAPSIDLPREITNIHQAKMFIAEKFGVPPENVWRMGERYFTHLGVTPMRIFPFAVATSGHVSTPEGGPVQFAPVRQLWNIIFTVMAHRVSETYLWAISAVHRDLGYNNDQNLSKIMGRAKSALDQAAASSASTSPIASLKDVSGMAGAKPQNEGQNSPKAPPPAPAAPPADMQLKSLQKTAEKQKNKETKDNGKNVGAGQEDQNEKDRKNNIPKPENHIS